MSYLVQGKLEQLLLGVAKHLTEFAVDAEISAFRRDLRHADGGQLKQRAKLLFPLAQPLVDLQTISYVTLCRDKVSYFPSLAPHRRHSPVKTKLRTILAIIDYLALKDVPGCAIAP